MRNAPLLPGVPSPYALHVHPYPTRFHGPIYTRPMFTFPVIARPRQVFTEGYDLDRGAPEMPVSGLGATVGEGLLWNTGNGVFRPGGYGGGVFDGDISGLGSLGKRKAMRGLGADDFSNLPWRTKDSRTAQLQQATNESLKKAGLCPLVVDGKLGGATCGARNYLTAHSQELLGQEMLFSNPAACDQHASELVRPTPQSEGCGSKATPLPATAPAALPAAVYQGGMSSSTKRLLGFAAGGLLAVGAVILLRGKR